MKTRFSHPLSQVVLTSILLVAVSIACTYKSAGSPPPRNDRAEDQPPVQTNNASPQERPPCTLTLAGAPNIKGLRLGMTTDEALLLFPGSKNDPAVRSDLDRPPSRFGTSSFGLSPNKYESKEKFTGVNQLMFRLLDGRVSSLRISYNGPAYAHVDSFIAKLAAETNLPGSDPGSDQWEVYVGMDNQLKTLRCKEFEVQAFVGGQGGNLNYVEMKDLIADKQLKDRRDKARAQATRSP